MFKLRKRDEKVNIQGKAAKTINFDKIVLIRLEMLAKKSGSNVSNIINMLCRRHVMTDPAFYSEMSREHYLKMQEYQWLKQQAQAYVEARE